jgi:glycosyltransferase involved in cell wall biosynthesis
MKKDELISIYRKCDIFVLPSFTETFGLVYPEAMSQGLPVIYSKDQGFDNWFPEGVVGYSADSKDVESVFDAISKTYSKYHEISINVLKNYRKFSWERIGPEYIELYKSIYNTEKT